MNQRQRPVAMIILDGFGIAPTKSSNAISVAQTPFFDSLVTRYPTFLLEASELNVGLPRGEVGNSEVGHTTIGSGILEYQSLPRIDRSISTGAFFKEPELIRVAEKIKKTDGKLHLVGLIGNGGIHASQEHLEALITFAKKNNIWKKTFIHAFLDGRDTPKNVATYFIDKLLAYTKDQHIATIGGRFYGMDRNLKWERTEQAYRAIVDGVSAQTFKHPIKAIESYYAEHIYDEEIPPTVITNIWGKPLATVEPGDVIIYFNFRADRGRQLTEAFVDTQFQAFQTKELGDIDVITFTEYKKGLPVSILFPTSPIQNPMTKVISDYNLKQLHVAETEKYAHITFFLNGRHETPFAGEQRILVPSPNVPSYDQTPEMSAHEMTRQILQEIQSDKQDFYAINYANPDMVGHTGNISACVKAIETVDTCLAQVIQAIVNKGGIAFIMSDHGNAEEMINLSTGQMDKEHNIYPVPFIIVGDSFHGQSPLAIKQPDLSYIPPIGILADIAPTILKTMGLNIPKEMTGTSLI
ncbi:2,3-bisphosphoglycerate-independent phosphoglycerate mutase [Patescibacteria group bacterium]|nr:2,3-bisphosphoglycerate-independent phosphoglycerate mutase [Patescibacteria group bacterium]MBU1721164.1 2,3-bisphosphoglycerate-independent phosphoglycerate mutase [Patescibacteria group bacterium]MBU1900906.1 2,3-bisphosphoglycerate-independent phosphoglycerate mutase [Patescibacteria group bacterium]